MLLSNISQGIGKSLQTGGGALVYPDDISSVCADLDITKADSYPGTGFIINNRIEGPADSSSQAAWRCRVGEAAESDVNAPAFVGEAGDPGAYLDFVYGDMCTFDTPPALVQEQFHKTAFDSTSLWFTMAMYKDAATTIFGLVGCGGYNNGTSGWCIDYTPTSNSMNLKVSGGTDYSSHPLDHSNNIIAEAWNFIAVSLTKTDADTFNSTVWINQDEGVTTTGLVFDQNPITAAASQNFTIGERGGNFGFRDGARLARFTVGNAPLPNAQLSAILNDYEAGHERTYRR